MSTKRIILNVLATYTQTAVSVVVGLFCSRWVYLALGEVAFGLFAVVGALIGFISFLNSAMVSSNSRFFAVAIGAAKRGTPAETDLLCKWFNTALSVHSILPVALIIVGYPVGVYCIRHVLTIPPESVESCIWVFRCSLLAAWTTMITVPFNALYTAKQFIFVRNLFGILQTLVWAVEGWWLLHYVGNRLIAHAAVLMVLIMALNAAIAALAMRTFPECRIKFAYWFDRSRLKELFSFASFSLLGSLGTLFSGSGVSMVVNIFLGPTMNAALGVGVHVSTKISMLSEAINSAISPEIATRIGECDMERARTLGVRVCFYSVAFSLTILMPLILYMENILALWLKTPPSWSTEIAIILLLGAATLNLTYGYRSLIEATGRIKAYKVVTSALNSSCIVLVGLLLSCGTGIVLALAVGWLIPKATISFVSVLFAKWLAGISLRDSVGRVAIPIGILGGASWLACLAIHSLVAFPLPGFLLTLLCNGLVIGGLFWLLLTPEERYRFRCLLRKGMTRVGVIRPSQSSL